MKTNQIWFYIKVSCLTLVLTLSSNGFAALKLANKNSSKVKETALVIEVSKGAIMSPAFQKLKFSNKGTSKQVSDVVILNWLLAEGRLVKDKSLRSKEQELYYPVKWKKSKTSQQLVYVPINRLARHKGLNFETLEPTLVLTRLPESTTKLEPTTDHLSGSIDLASTSDLSGTAEPTQDGLTNLFLGLIQKKLESKQKKISLALTSGQSKNFSETCPLTFETFQKEVFTTSVETQVPAEILFSMMQVESAGKCSATREEWDESESVGLFQVNSGTSMIPLCNKNQLKKISKHQSLKVLKSKGLNCLNNPIVNLNEAAKILAEKYRSVNGEVPSLGASFSWSQMNSTMRDQWRKSISAYNGGQNYVIKAKHAIVDFNELHKTKFNSEKWEVRRAFLLFDMLDKYQKATNGSTGLRSTEHNMINLNYVDRIAGREATDQGPSLVSKWDELID